MTPASLIVCIPFSTQTASVLLTAFKVQNPCCLLSTQTTFKTSVAHGTNDDNGRVRDFYTWVCVCVWVDLFFKSDGHCLHYCCFHLPGDLLLHRIYFTRALLPLTSVTHGLIPSIYSVNVCALENAQLTTSIHIHTHTHRGMPFRM